MNAQDLLAELGNFANQLEVTWQGSRRSWADHCNPKRGGFVDEAALVQPVVFPAFASRFLGWSVGTDLAAEDGDASSKPDFSPDDRVTHRFVFETKGTSEGIGLTVHDEQVRKYLASSQTERIVLTNMITIRVMKLTWVRLSWRDVQAASGMRLLA